MLTVNSLQSRRFFELATVIFGFVQYRFTEVIPNILQHQMSSIITTTISDTKQKITTNKRKKKSIYATTKRKKSKLSKTINIRRLKFQQQSIKAKQLEGLAFQCAVNYGLGMIEMASKEKIETQCNLRDNMFTSGSCSNHSTFILTVLNAISPAQSYNVCTECIWQNVVLCESCNFCLKYSEIRERDENGDLDLCLKCS